MMGGGASFDWATLVPHVVHPAKVAIIEAMLWVQRPLSATELCDLFDEPEGMSLPTLSYHVRGLAEVGALELREQRQVRGAFQSLYFLSPAANGAATP